MEGSTEGVADHARRESRRIFSHFIYITSGLSYYLEQKFSNKYCAGRVLDKPTLDFPSVPFVYFVHKQFNFVEIDQILHVQQQRIQF